MGIGRQGGIVPSGPGGSECDAVKPGGIPAFGRVGCGRAVRLAAGGDTHSLAFPVPSRVGRTRRVADPDYSNPWYANHSDRKYCITRTASGLSGISASV